MVDKKAKRLRTKANLYFGYNLQRGFDVASAHEYFNPIIDYMVHLHQLVTHKPYTNITSALGVALQTLATVAVKHHFIRSGVPKLNLKSKLIPLDYESYVNIGSLQAYPTSSPYPLSYIQNTLSALINKARTSLSLLINAIKHGNRRFSCWAEYVSGKDDNTILARRVLITHNDLWCKSCGAMIANGNINQHRGSVSCNVTKYRVSEHWTEVPHYLLQYKGVKKYLKVIPTRVSLFADNEVKLAIQAWERLGKPLPLGEFLDEAINRHR
jgi:hypothetical protein